ncbi:MAG: hypothetical protein PHF63_00540 [Herbinix sp.]|nr:hypothetical protein [Herbinix sp.]
MNFKKGHDKVSIESIFLYGNCYHFSLILSQLYPGGKIMYDQMDGHFIYKYFNSYYDITGKIGHIENHDVIVGIDELESIDPLLHERIINDCVWRK